MPKLTQREIAAYTELGELLCPPPDRAQLKRTATKRAVAALAKRLSKLPKSKQAYWLKRLTQLMKG